MQNLCSLHAVLQPFRGHTHIGRDFGALPARVRCVAFAFPKAFSGSRMSVNNYSFLVCMSRWMLPRKSSSNGLSKRLRKTPEKRLWVGACRWNRTFGKTLGGEQSHREFGLVRLLESGMLPNIPAREASHSSLNLSASYYFQHFSKKT